MIPGRRGSSLLPKRTRRAPAALLWLLFVGVVGCAWWLIISGRNFVLGAALILAAYPLLVVAAYVTARERRSGRSGGTASSTRDGLEWSDPAQSAVSLSRIDRLLDWILGPFWP